MIHCLALPLQAVSLAYSIVVFGTSMAFALIYVWAREVPDQTVRAPTAAQRALRVMVRGTWISPPAGRQRSCQG